MYKYYDLLIFSYYESPNDLYLSCYDLIFIINTLHYENNVKMFHCFRMIYYPACFGTDIHGKGFFPILLKVSFYVYQIKSKAGETTID